MLTWLLFLNGCELWWDTWINPNLPDNEVTLIMKTFAKQLKLKEIDIKEESFYWYNYADPDYWENEISWYIIQKSGIKEKDLPNTTQLFDGRYVEYVWDEIWWSLIDFSKDNIICSQWLFYDQEIPYELMVREPEDWWEYDEEEYNKAWKEFTDNVTYHVELSCGFKPAWSLTFQDFYYNAEGMEPFWSMSIRWSQVTRFNPENVKDYYLYTLEKDGDNIHFNWYDIDWDIIKEDCIDGGKWDTHDYKITVYLEWDMGFMWCADKYDTDFVIGEEWTLWNFVKKTNYQYKWNNKRENVSYDVFSMVNNYMYAALYENDGENYEPTNLIMEKTDNWWKVLYEWDYEVDDDKCEELFQYDNYLMEMFFFRNCPRG